MKTYLFVFGTAFFLSGAAVFFVGASNDVLVPIDLTMDELVSVDIADEPEPRTADIQLASGKSKKYLISQTVVEAVQADASTELSAPLIPDTSFQSPIDSDTSEFEPTDFLVAQSTQQAPLGDFEAPFAPKFSPSPIPAKVETSKDLSESIVDSLVPTTPTNEEVAELTALREQFNQLAYNKSELLNAKALRSEIGKLKNEIANLHAARSLLDAQLKLKKLIEEFPDSPAASRAKFMLNQSATRLNSVPELHPIPDPTSNIPIY